MSKTEIKYRTFQELLDSVKIDFRGYDLESFLETQTLIKVAMRVSYELGLKINPSRSKLLEVKDGKARLPKDFDVMNFALLCEEKTGILDEYCNSTYVESILDELRLRDLLATNPCIINYTEFITINPGNNQILHGLNSTSYIVQAFAPDGSLLSFNVETVTANEINIISYNPTSIQNVKVTIFAVPYDPSSVEDAAATLSCNSDGTSVVNCRTGESEYSYKYLQPLEMVPSKSVSADCFNIQVRGKYKARLENGFFKSNIPYAVVFINYQSLMEDDEGNLLVMDHPLVNEYYEYALKERILEDMLIQGELVDQKYQLMVAKLRMARNNALSFVNTPNFGELMKMWDANRRAQYYKYYDMFKTLI